MNGYWVEIYNSCNCLIGSQFTAEESKINATVRDLIEGFPLDAGDVIKIRDGWSESVDQLDN